MPLVFLKDLDVPDGVPLPHPHDDTHLPDDNDLLLDDDDDDQLPDVSLLLASSRYFIRMGGIRVTSLAITLALASL